VAKDASIDITFIDSPDDVPFHLGTFSDLNGFLNVYIQALSFGRYM